MHRYLISIFWPAFLVASVLTIMVFAMVDPLELAVVHEWLGSSRMAGYSLGFLMFWICCTLSSACTLYFHHTMNQSRK